ncbi:MAG: metal-dependent hydrolase family protein [Candidatus Dormibacteria bacterium]
MSLVLTGAPLIDGTGRDPFDATVLVEGDRITSLAAIATPAGTEILDVSGLTLLPGLIDAHSHLGVVSAGHMAELPLAVIAGYLFGNSERCLMSGHTTAREVAGADGGLKRAIELRLVKGPRLYPSGPLISQTGGHGDHWFSFLEHHHTPYFGNPGLSHTFDIVDGPDEMRRAVRNAFKHGATQIKLCVSGGVVSATDSLTDTQFSIDEMKVAVEEAKARGTYVTAHALNKQSVLNGLAAGLECFEHGVGLDENTVARLAKAGAAVVPTLTVLALIFEKWRDWGIPEDVLPKARGLLDDARRSVKLAYDGGVMVGSGSDELGPDQDRRGLEISLKADVIGAMAAIVSATQTNARIMRVAEDLGTVEVGKLADVIAVDGDPLSEPALFDDPSRVKLVIKDGVVVKDIRS